MKFLCFHRIYLKSNLLLLLIFNNFYISAQNSIELQSKNAGGQTWRLMVQYSECDNNNGNEQYGPSSFQIQSDQAWPNKGVLTWKARFINCNNDAFEQIFYIDVSNRDENQGTEEINDQLLEFNGIKVEDVFGFNLVNGLPAGSSRSYRSNPVKVETARLPSMADLNQIPDFLQFDGFIDVQIKGGKLPKNDKYIWFDSENNQGFSRAGNLSFVTDDNRLKISAKDLKKSYLCVGILGKPNFGCNCKKIIVNKGYVYRETEVNNMNLIKEDLASIIKQKISNEYAGSIYGFVYLTSMAGRRLAFYSKSNTISDLPALMNIKATNYKTSQFYANGKNYEVDSRDSIFINVNWTTRELVMNHQEIKEKYRKDLPAGDYNVKVKICSGQNVIASQISGVQITGKKSKTIKIPSSLLPAWNGSFKTAIFSSVIAFASKMYSNKQYEVYKNSLSQAEMEKSYNRANFSNKAFIVSGVFSGLGYLGSVIIKNNEKYRNQKKRLSIKEIIPYTVNFYF
jgi:hypothetical protein